MATAENPPTKSSFSFWRVLLSGAVLGGICVGVFKWAESGIRERSQRESERNAAHWFRLTTPTPRSLDARFTDADSDLVADPPASASARQSPEKLAFSFVAGPEAENQIADFKDFVGELSRVTGKPVETAVFPSIEEQQAALSKGRLHVTAFNTGAVPSAVASAGFVPVCTFGADDGTFGITMKIIVPAKSAIRKVDDLKGRTIAFTSLNSNSGCKAAVVLLQDRGMLPTRDYKWVFSAAQEFSIKGVADGEYEVAPVASDLLQRAISKGLIKPEAIRVVYESERFPPVTFGCVYDLSDELAGKIRRAFLEFRPPGTSLAKRFEDSLATKFVPVSYKQDFALVRRVDSAFQPASGD